VIIIRNISTIYAFLAAGYQRLFAVVENEHALVECVIAEPPWRNRHRLSGSEFPTAPIFPRYQY
jgi:hypothetical protein